MKMANSSNSNVNKVNWQLLAGLPVFKKMYILKSEMIGRISSQKCFKWMKINESHFWHYFVSFRPSNHTVGAATAGTMI